MIQINVTTLHVVPRSRAAESRQPPSQTPSPIRILGSRCGHLVSRQRSARVVCTPGHAGPREKSPPRTTPRGGAGHKIDRAGRGGASFWVPRSLPRSGAPPSAPRFFSGVDRAFYGRDRIFYGRDGVFRTICEVPAYFKLLRYAGAAKDTPEVRK